SCHIRLLTHVFITFHPFSRFYNFFPFFFFNDTPTTEIYTLSLHDALPISADLPPSPTKSSNLSETAEVPACNVPSRSPLPALAIAPETKLGTASSGLGTLEP